MRTANPALNVALDFDFIEKGAATGAPMSIAWYRACGLMGAPVWLYRESLKLLAKMRGRGSSGSGSYGW
jgi:uncharacterized YccA/Bax inhibitor family protein